MDRASAVITSRYWRLNRLVMTAVARSVRGARASSAWRLRSTSVPPWLRVQLCAPSTPSLHGCEKRVRRSLFAAFLLATVVNSVQHGQNHGEKGDTTEQDEEPGHRLLLPVATSAATTSVIQTAKPRRATPAENGRTPRNWPNTIAPAAMLATSRNVSAKSARCSGLHPNLLFALT